MRRAQLFRGKQVKDICWMVYAHHAYYGLMVLVMVGGSWRVICQISTLNYLLPQSKIEKGSSWDPFVRKYKIKKQPLPKIVVQLLCMFSYVTSICKHQQYLNSVYVSRYWDVHRHSIKQLILHTYTLSSCIYMYRWFA